MFFKRMAATVTAVLLTHSAAAMPFDQMFPNHPGYDQPELDAILQSLDYQNGTIKLPGGQAELDVPLGYYYLSPEDAETVLVELWDNPPSYELGLGMIFPAAYTPWDYEAWGAEISFEAIGYVSDDDAESYDYDALLKDMQSDARASSRARIEQGYDGFELLGWAEAPSYDATTRKLHWAMELKFDGSESNTLNYELRALGREGVLNANFIGGMEQLPQIKRALPDVAGMVNFVEGKRYSDFDPSVDTVAAVGIGGLIAGKALTSKAGIGVAIALLLKKFWFVLLLPLFWLKNLFGARRA